MPADSGEEPLARGVHPAPGSGQEDDPAPPRSRRRAAGPLAVPADELGTEVTPHGGRPARRAVTDHEAGAVLDGPRPFVISSNITQPAMVPSPVCAPRFDGPDDVSTEDQARGTAPFDSICLHTH
ncbi:MAG: hypothetical protein WKF75_07865 [Singulisphaera sp.]